MKNILLSVDFSKNAKLVALQTAEMAQLSKARLIIFHAYCPVAVSDHDQEVGTSNERLVQTRLDKLACLLHKETGVSITRLMKPATNNNEALEVARIVKADIAVIYSQAIKHQKAVSITCYHGLHVLTVPTYSCFDQKAFQAGLTEQLQLLGYTSSPLPEAI